jgi:hypothetical protein
LSNKEPILPSGARILDPSQVPIHNSINANAQTSEVRMETDFLQTENFGSNNNPPMQQGYYISPFPPAPTPPLYTPRIQPPLPMGLPMKQSNRPMKGPPRRGPPPMGMSPALRYFEQQQNSHHLLLHKIPRGTMMSTSDVKYVLLIINMYTVYNNANS